MKMSFCKQIGKDKIIFATKEDHLSPSTVKLQEPEPTTGLILPNGDINWNCPCLGGMAAGPCGVQFREAFSCFHYSEAEPKGADCYDAFKIMQECMSQYPKLYKKDDGVEDEEDVSMALTGASNNNDDDAVSGIEQSRVPISASSDTKIS